MAFRYARTDVVIDLDGNRTREPTEDALLGALIQAEEGAALLSLVEAFGEFAKAWAASKQRRRR